MSTWARLIMYCNVIRSVPDNYVYQNRTEASLHKKRNLADVGMHGSMNAMVDKVHKQGMPHSDMGALLCETVYASPRSWLVEIGITEKGPQNHGFFL